MTTWALALMAALAIPAPAAVVPATTADTAMPNPGQVMVLPPELRSRLQGAVIAKGRAQRLEQLVDFMFAEHGLGMQYQNDATYTVEQAFATRKANCLSFTLLFIALAREFGLDVYAQEIEESLAWYQEEKTVYRTNHINAVVRVSGRHYTVDVARDSIIAWRSPKRITDERLLAHYYNNRAAELVAHGAMAAALPYMQTALELDPTYATSWSNAGVVYMRNGDRAGAERAYATALRLDPMHAGALFNLVGLYQRIGDREHEEEFRRRLENARLKDPFHQFLLALESENRGDYPRAIDHYQRAIRLYDGEYRFYAGLARVYLLMGETQRAGRAQARAQALIDDAAAGIPHARLDGRPSQSR